MAKLERSINSRIEAHAVENEHRGYLGMSQLGHSCARYLWYVLHDSFQSTATPRTRRIWERGDWEEDRVIKDLRKIGATVYDTQATINLHSKYILGHIDGIVRYDNVDYLLEIKTMNSTSWKKYCKTDLKEYSKQYWVQANLYAKYMSLNNIMHVGVNKDTEERHFKCIEAEPDQMIPYEIRAIEILDMRDPPEKIGNASWWECKWCPAFDHCQNYAPRKFNCRSCKHISFPDSGLACALGKEPIAPCVSWK